MRRTLGLTVVLVTLSMWVTVSGMLYARYGGGVAYPDLSTQPVHDASELETVVTSPEPIGNVAVSADGRVFYTIHPESRPKGAKLIEWVDGKPVAYPSEEAQAMFDTVLGVTIDPQHRLWTIDHGNHGTGDAKLVAFDLATGELVHEHVFDRKSAPLGSFLQDQAVNAAGTHVFIADVSFWRNDPALVVYDVQARTARRVLQDHPSVSPQNWLIRNPVKNMRFFGGLVDLKPGVDGIALSRDDKWLWFGAMVNEYMYRVRVADLTDPSLSDDQIANRVVRVGKKPLNDGLSTDNDGNVLITDVEHSSVVRMTPTGELQTLIQSPSIRWADALSYGAHGWLYVADSAIPDQMLQSKAHIEERAPYYIYRFKPTIAGAAGQ